MLHTIWQDVRHAARTLRGTPLFTAVSILSLAIGIAGPAVIFSLADAYLFRARPSVADSSARLVELGRIDTETASGDVVPGAISTFSYPNYLDYLERQTVFDALAATRTGVMFGLGGELSLFASPACTSPPITSRFSESRWRLGVAFSATTSVRGARRRLPSSATDCGGRSLAAKPWRDRADDHCLSCTWRSTGV